MNFLFAWRYFKSKKSTNAINLIAWISVTAIAVGTAALIIVLSVFNGFEGLVKGLYSDFYADIRIAPATGKTFHISAEQVQKISTTTGVLNVSAVVEEKAVLMNGDCSSIVYIRGVDEYFTSVSKISNHIRRGKFELGTADAPKIVVGVGIENAACVDVERPTGQLTLYMPNRGRGNFGSGDALNAFNVDAVGTFMVQQDFDNKYIFSNIGFMRFMLSMQADEYSALDIRAGAEADRVKKALQEMLGKDFLVQTRYEQNQSLYTVMQIEKWVIYGILSLILVVAAFNMIGALTMLVLEKQKDIAVLQAMGANANRIKGIFLSEGLLLAGLGGISGMLIAAFVCWVQLQFQLVKLGGNTFIIDYYPVKMVLGDFILVGVTVFLIAILAAYIPSRKASLQEFSLKS
ncbi:MAG: FtsX-like permease family protein [Chitinophagaceae bacterium]|nr:FtsX-like permease family protein [Chitinophagaceae bacterium]